MAEIDSISSTGNTENTKRLAELSAINPLIDSDVNGIGVSRVLSALSTLLVAFEEQDALSSEGSGVLSGVALILDVCASAVDNMREVSHA